MRQTSTGPTRAVLRLASLPAALALGLGFASSASRAQAAAEASPFPSSIGSGAQDVQLIEALPPGQVNVPQLSTDLPLASSSALPPGPGANNQVLQAWQQQTGQAVWMNDQGQLEFHGALTVDVYNNSKRIASGNPVLSSLPEGTFGRATLQGDLRTTSPDNDVTYLQGVLTHGNDRSTMTRYDTQVNSLQAGRAGPGYQISVGDVVAGFSGLSSNLGLRGLLGARQVDAFTFTGFAGTVTESWESLLDIRPLDGFATRSRYSRDVYGGKAEWAYSPALTAFATLQGWRDRLSSAVLPVGSAAASGVTGTLGGRYALQQGQLAVEAARSSLNDISSTAPGIPGAGTDLSGSGFTADGSYRWERWGLRGGYHDLSTGFTSLAQTVAPGVREWYAGGDWLISSELTWSVDLRHALSRTVPTAFFPSTSNILDSLTNRLTYNLASLPGLMLNISDTRNQGRDGTGNATRNTQTQYGASYAAGLWNGQLSLGSGRTRSPAAPASDSDSKLWQVGVGRSFRDTVAADLMPRWTLSTQLFASGQDQRLVNAVGSEVRTLALGLNASLQSDRYGTLTAGWQRQRSTQPLAGAAALVTQGFNLDWALQLTRQWGVKTYARINHRNHGDFLLRADETVVGVQGVYQW